jgi:hypothetical protein
VDEDKAVLGYSIRCKEQMGLQTLIAIELGLMEGGPDDSAFIPFFEPLGCAFDDDGFVGLI